MSGSWTPTESGAVEGPPIPGLLIRRAHQANTALWALCIPEDVTIRQFAILRVLAEGGQLDQTTLGRLAALDRSNTAEILSRLDKRGLVRSRRDERDGRRNVWTLTADGEALFRRTNPMAAATTELLLAALPAADRLEFLRLLQLLVEESEQRIEHMQRQSRRGG